MSTQQTQRSLDGSVEREFPHFEIDALPESVETAEPKLVYLYLSVVEEATIEDLSETLGMKLLTLYPLLSTLTEDDLVERRGETFAAV